VVIFHSWLNKTTTLVLNDTGGKRTAGQGIYTLLVKCLFRTGNDPFGTTSGKSMVS
jgi:hypothetical protein